MPGAARFKRMLLGMHHGALDPAMLSFAAGFARSLHLDLLAMIMEEPRLAGLAALPRVREFGMLGGQWRTVESARIVSDFELAASLFRRRVTGVAASHRLTCAFETIRGPSREAIQAHSQATDIIVLSEPSSPLDKIVGSFPEFAAAALQSKAAVLYSPHRISPEAGPIVAIATSAEDPSIDTAIGIAAATGNRAVLLTAFPDAARISRDMDDAKLPVQEVRSIPRSAIANEKYLSTLLGAPGEGLIVMTRDPADDRAASVAAALSSLRRAPVLVLESQSTA